MNNFKQSIKKRMLRNLVLGLLLIPIAIVTAIHFFQRKVIFSGTPFKEFISGFFNGVQSALVAGFIFYLICMAHYFYKTAKDEKKLKELYILENDEREHAITYCAANSTKNIIYYLLLTGSIIAGWFSATISLTLLITWVVFMVINLLSKGYYSKKM